MKNWPGWSKVATRKPLAVYIVLFISVVILCYTYKNRDIPFEIASILKIMFYGGVVGYIGSSTFEHYTDTTKSKPTPPKEE